MDFFLRFYALGGADMGCRTDIKMELIYEPRKPESAPYPYPCVVRRGTAPAPTGHGPGYHSKGGVSFEKRRALFWAHI